LKVPDQAAQRKTNDGKQAKCHSLKELENQVQEFKKLPR
jgi:hypothetical protein